MKPLIIRRFRLQVDRAGRLHRRCQRGPACGVPGCQHWGHPCWLPDAIYQEPSEYYCDAHMRDQGYCPGCGNFWAGIESFDFSRSGYCENCAAEFDDDWDADRDEWDDMPHRYDPWEEAMSNCFSRDWGQTCGAAGSEDCEFDCRIRRDYYRSVRVDHD